LTHQPNYSPATQKLPPRPHATNIARPNKGNIDPKRRRHEDDNNRVTTTSPLPTHATFKSSNNLDKPIPPIQSQPKSSPQINADPKNLKPLHEKSTTHVSTNIDQTTPLHTKDYNTILTPTNLAATQHKSDPLMKLSLLAKFILKTLRMTLKSVR
jgi:hypothetical protein